MKHKGEGQEDSRIGDKRVGGLREVKILKGWEVGEKGQNYAAMLYIYNNFGEKLLRHCPQMGYRNFGEQNNSQPFLLSSIQSWGVCFFLQLAQTAASHCIDGVGRERFLFSFFKLSWQNVREDLLGKVCQLILSPIVAIKIGLKRGRQEKRGRRQECKVWET